MSDHAKQMTEDEAAEFAEQVFDVARRGDAALLAALLAKGLPANLRNHNGDTLLMLAAYHGHADAVRVLLEFKADPQIANDKHQLPIAGAAFKGNLPVVKALIEGGAPVDASSSDGRTALMMAAMFNASKWSTTCSARAPTPRLPTPRAHGIGRGTDHGRGGYGGAVAETGVGYAPSKTRPPQDPFMKNALVELIRKISAGVMGDDEVARIAEEAAQAYADPVAFLAANPDINYDDTFPIPLGEWVVVGSLPDTVLFQADTYGDLFAQIVASFGPGVAFNLKPKQLAKTEALTALNRIQIQMSALSPQDGGYVLLNFSQPLDDEIQAVLVYGNDLPRVLELCAEVGIHGEPSLEALRVAVHV